MRLIGNCMQPIIPRMQGIPTPAHAAYSVPFSPVWHPTWGYHTPHKGGAKGTGTYHDHAHIYGLSPSGRYAPYYKSYRRQRYTPMGYRRKRGRYSQYYGKPYGIDKYTRAAKYFHARLGTQFKGKGAGGYRTGGFLGLEIDFFDSSLAATSIQNTWTLHVPATILCLSAAPQGSAEQTRAGREMSMLSLNIRGQFTTAEALSQTSPSSTMRVRMVIFIDTQTNGAAATPTDVIETAVAASIHNFRNLEHTDRFKILYDKSFIWQPQQMNEGAVLKFAFVATAKPFNIYHKFSPPLKIKYKSGSTTGVIGNLTTNSIQMICIGTDTTPSIEYHCRIRYTS